MSKFPIKFVLLYGAAMFLAMPVLAQTPAAPAADAPAVSAPAADDGRDASFLPPKGVAPVLDTNAGQPVALQPSAAPAVAAPSANPPLISMPPAASPPSSAPTATSPPVSYPAAPAASTTPLPASTPDPHAVISRPVESGGTLQTIDPDAIGLMGTQEGGLGAAMWKGTARDLVTRLLPLLPLPSNSAALNNLAQRFLLTTASIPEGTASSNDRSLISMRIEKLVALGDAGDAWKLAAMAKPGQVDEITLRMAVEASLVSSDNKKICEQLPKFVEGHTSPEWQKSLVVCQLLANNTQAAQLGIDVLHTQDVKDDIFFQLIEHNILGGAKGLPRQLTPLKPLNMALLSLAALPLPPEIYSRPDASVIAALLQAKARDDNARLALAEKAAARGLIDGNTLGNIYRSISFTPDQLTNAMASTEGGGRLHALLYQASLQEKTEGKRLDEASKFIASMDAGMLAGSVSNLLADMIKFATPSSDFVVRAPMATRIYIMANRPKEALAWLKITQQAALSSPNAAQQLQDFWPLVALAGIEADSDYSKDLSKWLDARLKDADRARREQVGGILLLLDAAGNVVPEEDWARVADEPAGERRAVMPPTLLFERLRAAGIANRRGEVVLYALAMGDSGTAEPPLLTSVETVRALRLAGLAGDAMALAREAAVDYLAADAGSADGKK